MNQPALIAIAVAGPAPFEPRKIVNQDPNTRRDMLQSNEIIRHGSR
jgi:3-methyladenine DNA glycosylase Tag